MTAFSREGPEKVYVQNRLWERAEEVDDLLRQNGHIYVCGSAANMAHDVKAVLGRIISDKRRISLKDAEGILQTMKSSAKYQVWNCPLLTMKIESRLQVKGPLMTLTPT